MRRFRMPVLGALLLVLAILVSACRTGGTRQSTDGKGSITVGSSSSFPENVLIAEMYAQALESLGFDVERQIPLATREISQPALEKGEIDVKPEYLLTLLRFYEPDAEGGSDPKAVADALSKLLEDKDLELLEYSDANDTNALVVKKETADQFKLTKISDLASVESQLKFAVPLECRTRPLCGIALKDKYGIELNTEQIVEVPACDAPAANALKAGSKVTDGADVALLCSTQAVIAKEGWVVLEDDEAGISGADNITPVIRSEVLTDEIAEILNKISAALDTQTITELNAKVEIDNEDEEDVAKEFLEKENII